MDSRSLSIHLYLNEDGKGGHIITRVIILARYLGGKGPEEEKQKTLIFTYL